VFAEQAVIRREGVARTGELPLLKGEGENIFAILSLDES